MIKNIILLILLILAFTAGAQIIKQDTTYKAKFYDPRIIRYLSAPPKDHQTNPYGFADSAKAKTMVEKSKKKTR